MNFLTRLSISLLISIAIHSPQTAIAKDIEEIADLAKKITVKVSQSSGGSNGSGVIFNRENETYFVITNRHVIVPGYTYSIQTQDGRSYPLTVEQEIGALDLMIVTFKSDEDYKRAELGKSADINQLQTVYVAGFPGRQENMDIIDGKVRRINEQVYENPQLNQGYAWEYSNETFPGSSGGAVLDDDGKLIGINGQSEVTVGGIEIRRGIPIHFLTAYLEEQDKLAEEAGSESEPEIIDMPPSNIVATNLRDDDAVTAVAISLNSAISVSGGEDEDIKVWNMYSNTLERTLKGHKDVVNAVAISPNNLSLLSGSDDKTIKLWNWQTWELKKTLKGHKNDVKAIAWSRNSDIAVSGSADKTVRIWNVSTGKLERTFDGHDGVVSTVAISNDSNTVVSGSWDKTIKVWSWRTWELKKTLEGHKELVTSVALTPDARTIVSASDDGTIKIWDLSAGTLKRTLFGHRDIINTIAISGDGRTLVSGSDDLTIKVWDLSTGNLKYSLEGHYDLINSVAVSYDGRTIVSGGEDETVKLWRLK